MSLAELSKMDIKDLKKIDLQEVLEHLRSKPEVALAIVMVVAALFGAFHLYGKRQGTNVTLRSELMELEKKVAAIEEYQKVQKETKDFWANIPSNISGEEMINLITDLAASRNIQINSLVPIETKAQDQYDLSGMTLTISSPEYKNIWLFIRDIENTEHAIRIDNLAGSLARPSGRRRGQSRVPDEDSKIEVRMQIASIAFKKK